MWNEMSCSRIQCITRSRNWNPNLTINCNCNSTENKIWKFTSISVSTHFSLWFKSLPTAENLRDYFKKNTTCFSLIIICFYRIYSIFSTRLLSFWYFKKVVLCGRHHQKHNNWPWTLYSIWSYKPFKAVSLHG